MSSPEPVAGVRWRAGTADDVDVLTRIQQAADLVDEPGHAVARSEMAQQLAGIDPDRVVVGERRGIPVAFGMPIRPGGGPVRLRGAVAPAARALGIGRELLRFQIERARALEPDAPALGLRSVGDGGVAPLARRCGFHAERQFLLMRRDLGEPIVAAPLAGGLRAVPFEERLDEPVRLAKNVVFRDHWQGLEDDPEEWRSRQLGPQLRRDLSRIALDADGGIAGFVLVAPTDDHPDEAYIPLVGTVRAHRGRGVARSLLTSALAAAAEEGFRASALAVDAASRTGAVRVYEKVGYSEVQRSTVWQRPLRA
jgi:mycothiol synthase